MDKVFYSVCGCKTETFFFVPLRDGRFICDGHGKNFDPFVILAEMIYICGAEYNLEGFMSFDIVMGKRYIAISCLMLLFLAACGENGDKSVSPEDEPVSEENSSSSSSVKLSSSSSVILSTNEEYSSSLVKSSCSAAVNSSSSVTLATPCKTDSTDTCEYGELIDDRDGRTYKTVKIGDQWWMAENLDYESADCYCYKDTASNCAKYGRLYTWAAAVDSVGLFSKKGKGCGDGAKCTLTEPVRGVCPSGWHLPSYDEWLTLCFAVSDYPGRDLKSPEGWYGTDVYGFSVLPAGISFSEGSFGGRGSDAYFWSSTEIGSGYSYSMQLKSNDVRVLLYHEYKFERFSIRCVKD